MELVRTENADRPEEVVFAHFKDDGRQGLRGGTRQPFGTRFRIECRKVRRTDDDAPFSYAIVFLLFWT